MFRSAGSFLISWWIAQHQSFIAKSLLIMAVILRVMNPFVHGIHVPPIQTRKSVDGRLKIQADEHANNSEDRDASSGWLITFWCENDVSSVRKKLWILNFQKCKSEFTSRKHVLWNKDIWSWLYFFTRVSAVQQEQLRTRRKTTNKKCMRVAKKCLQAAFSLAAVNFARWIKFESLNPLFAVDRFLHNGVPWNQFAAFNRTSGKVLTAGMGRVSRCGKLQVRVVSASCSLHSQSRRNAVILDSSALRRGRASCAFSKSIQSLDFYEQ